MDHAFYLAYGSNLLPSRLSERVPGARPLQAVRLPGYRLAFHKIGRDGSGKCDLVACPGAEAWGALYAVPDGVRRLLDAFEGPDYEVRVVDVEAAAGCLRCFSYFARPDWVDEGLKPFDWYHALVCAGAAHHGFPEPYRAALDAVAAVPDPDRRRHRRHWRLLP